MKNTKTILLAALSISIFACNDTKNDTRDTESTTGSTGYSTGSTANTGNMGSTTGSTMGSVDTSGTYMNKEWDDYRSRMNRRIDELENDISEAKERRRAEKNAKRIKEYDVDIERREKRRTEFQENVDNFEARSKESWQKFKAELDDLFTRDEKDVDTKKR
jgi:hypothetical protein